MKKLVISILSICIFITLTACGNKDKSYSKEVEINEINVPIGSNELQDKTYDEVKEIFKSAGFTDIEKSEVKDLNLQDKDKEFLVSSMKINGDSDFTKDDKYSDNSKVIIEYHIEKDIEMPKASYEYNNDNYEGVVQSLEELGFSNIQTKSYSTSSSSEALKDKVKSIKIDGKSSFKKGAKFSIESNVIIEYYMLSNEAGNIDEDDDAIDSKSNAKLSIRNAKKTFEKYGRKVWKKGFKCHWALGVKDKKQLSDDSWYLKVKVTIKEQNGNKRDVIAEGVVTGNNASSQVLKFDIVG